MRYSKLFVNCINLLSKRHVSNAVCPPDSNRFIVSLLDMSSLQAEMVALLLKQSPLVRELRLYDDQVDICGSAIDLSDIDTSAKMFSYTGEGLLKSCIEDSHLVITCGGGQVSPSERYEETFDKNVCFVRKVGLFLTEFNRDAIFCIAKPPVESLVPMVYQEYMKADVPMSDQKIVGAVNYNLMRANYSIARSLSMNPYKVHCPIIGGSSPKTVVAVTSQARPGSNISDHKVIAQIQEQSTLGEEFVLKVRIKEDSSAVNIASAVGVYRLATSILRGLRGDGQCIECAFVKQEGHLKKLLPYLTSIVCFGRHGILSTHMPELSGGEIFRLQAAYPHLRKHIFLGESYVTGGVFPHEPEPCHESDKCKILGHTDRAPKIITPTPDVCENAHPKKPLACPISS